MVVIRLLASVALAFGSLDWTDSSFGRMGSDTDEASEVAERTTSTAIQLAGANVALASFILIGV